MRGLRRYLVGVTCAFPLIVVLIMAFGGPAVRAQTNPDTGTINIMTPEVSSPAHRHKARHGRAKPETPAPAGERKRAGTPQPKIRRGSSNPVYPAPLPAPQGFSPPPSHAVVTRPPAVPPSLYVPQTGRSLPNVPAISGSGPGGSETYQDRAARCAHQAGVYGPAATGDRNAYIGGCINQ
jgi:hypothetical protein